MRTRHKRLTDYGIPDVEISGLYDLCKNLDDRGRGLLQIVVKDSCPPGIAEYILKSLTDGSSYDAMSKRGEWIPIGRDDFYRYRWKTLAAFYWKLEGSEINGRLWERRIQQNT
ncbi:MAG: hypothetical protein LUD07_01695 [Clostridiales bacterium]|nr:hypothetical protein [Clostridiales bacterium]